jgi:anti-sigma-K factor RskA
MIDERHEENACLYVAGALTQPESRAFKDELRANPELQKLVKQLRDSASALALAEPPVAPPPQLKDKILAKIAREPEAGKIISLPVAAKNFPSLWLPWALAAGFAFLAVVQFLQAQSLRQQTRSLNSAVAGLSTQVADLQKKDTLSQMRITMLNSLLDNSPKAVAVSVWDNEKQSGVLVVQNLAPAPTGKDYQLWVINDKYPAPVNAGVFSVDEKGTVHFTFKPDMPMTSVDKYAVTVERKGGVPKAEGKVALLGS